MAQSFFHHQDRAQPAGKRPVGTSQGQNAMLVVSGYSSPLAGVGTRRPVDVTRTRFDAARCATPSRNRGFGESSAPGA